MSRTHSQREEPGLHLGVYDTEVTRKRGREMLKRKRSPKQLLPPKKRRQSRSQDETAVARLTIAGTRYHEDQEHQGDDHDEKSEGRLHSENIISTGVDCVDGVVTSLGRRTGARHLRKRDKPSAPNILRESCSAGESCSDESSDSSDCASQARVPRRLQRPLQHVEHPGWKNGPAFSRRLYGWEPDVETLPEHRALPKLIEAISAQAGSEKSDYTYITLEQFCVYKPTDNYKHAQTLVALHDLSRDRHQEFSFDGILSSGQERCSVENVRFRILAIDGYDDSNATDIENQICIQSLFANRHNERVWYQLGSPAPEYRRFYEPFLWVARFTKHAVNYLLSTEGVTLQYFRGAFFEWLHRTYGKEKSVQTWLAAVKTRDFAVHFVAYVDFLWKESHGVQQPDDEIKICRHPIWQETLPYEDHLKAIPRQQSRQHTQQPKTIVTPFAYENFKSIYFHDQLLETPITDPIVLSRVSDLKAKRGLTPWYSQSPSTLTPLSIDNNDTTGDVVVGDVVAVPPDREGSWKSSAETWYAYVQRVWEQKDGQTRLDVIWLYHVHDTTIGKADYLFSNELFFSDNCGCGLDEALYQEEVTHKVAVAWNPRDASSQQGWFIRQKFRTIAEMDHYDFQKLQDRDFRCCHQPDYQAETTPQYQIGDAVLVQKKPDSLGRNCEPAQILGFDKDHKVQLRRLLRKADFSPSAKPNELLLTSQIFAKKLERVVRECHVKFFSEAEFKAGLPTPYDRGGAGDYFFVIGRASSSGDVDDGSSSLGGRYWPLFPRAWDSQQPACLRKLRGLGIFCGGGTFDRGLQEGGAVRFTHAVDYAQHALHSYKANTSEPVKFFLGSVDDYLDNALSGQSLENVANTGDIEVISAGSPCQGFSRLQLDASSERSRKNASMVASVVSFVDFYVPEYLILENVVSMTESVKDRKDSNVFSQILSALVGLGYQVQQFLMDSWSFGSPQQRSRVFVIATAPSAVPLSKPECTHAHSVMSLRGRKLGRSSNGLPFGTRKKDPFAALPFVTAAQASADLPSVYDSVPQLCTRFPDHRLAVLVSAEVRARISMVPTRPRGWGIIQAHNAGLLRGEPAEYFERTKRNHVRSDISSKSYTRVDPDHLFPTIITKLCVADGVNGRVLHWDQHRPLTVMECRRALGYLDHEVLIGSPAQQLHIVGNSVDRKVALVLGLALRESWLKSADSTDGDRGGYPDSDSGASVLAEFPGTEAWPPSSRGTDGSDAAAEDIAIDNRTVKMYLNMIGHERQDVVSAHEEHA